MKILACADLVPGCPAVVRGESEAEILRVAAEHAAAAHGLAADDGLVAAARAAIREEGEPEPGP